MGKHNNDQSRAMETRGYITIAEAARRLRVTAQAIYTALGRDQLKGTVVGKRRYVEVKSLLEYAGPVGRQLYAEAVKQRGMP